MDLKSAACQQHKKLDIQEIEDSPEPQETSNILEKLVEIINELHKTMFNAKYLTYSLSPRMNSITESLDYLTSLVKSLKKCLCVADISLEKSAILIDKPNTFNTIQKMIRAPIGGIYLKQSECKEISSLLIGDLRDVENNALKEKLMKSQQQIVKYAKAIQDFREKLEQKQKDVEYLHENIDLLNSELSKYLIPRTNTHVKTLSAKFSGESTIASINYKSALSDSL
jgi:hypothetical protein